MRTMNWFVPASLALSLSACAGELNKPERFETGQSAASADDDDAGSSAAPADAGGGNGGGSECGSTVELLKMKCGNAGCHGAAAPAAKLDLESDGLAERLKDAPSSAACEGYSQIDSADPGQSLLYLKVTANPPCEPRMPIGVPLSDAEQACLLQWLEQL